MSRYRIVAKKVIAKQVEKFLFDYKQTTAITERDAKKNFLAFQANIAILTNLFAVTTSMTNGREEAYTFYHSQVKVIRKELEQ